ncbi:isocitrate dehydrogenase [Shigella flexneri]
MKVFRQRARNSTKTALWLELKDKKLLGEKPAVVK